MKQLGAGALKTICGLTNSIRYDYIYCDSTYSGLLMSSLDKIMDEKDMFLRNAELQLNKLKPREDPHVIIVKEQDRYPGVLKTRRCFAGLISNKQVGKDSVYTGSVLHVIWFDDGDIPVEESLMDILPEIDWENNAKNFDY